jgi:hypothetical protein
MDHAEAKAVLSDHLAQWRQRKYAELVGLLGKPRVAELRGPSGTTYQVVVEAHWDDRPGGPVRVLASIDDGGWRALKPLTDDFIVAPDRPVGHRG